MEKAVVKHQKIWIKNGEIVDGTGQPSFKGDVFIEDHIIKAITHAEDVEHKQWVQNFEDDALMIDASGLVVSPGFIDTHSHSDLKVLIEPEVFPKLHQGITTEVLGQDGISMAPLPPQYISAWRKNLAGLDGESDAIDWHFETTANYLAMIEAAKPSINESYLLPHGNVRMAAMGLEGRQATAEEIQKMCDITRREMAAGCLGLSSGLIYMPCAYSNTEEIIALCKVIAAYDGVFVVHQRSEADTIIPSMKEIVEIGQKSGVKIHFSHFKICGKQNWHFLPEMFKVLDDAKAKGVKVTLDQYPYVAGSTMLGVILPPWAHDGGTDELLRRLEDETARARMKHDIAVGIAGWDNFVAFAGLDQIFITSVNTEQNRDTIGLSLVELGERKGKDPLDATFDLLLEEKNAVGMVDFYGLETHVVEIMKRPEMNACTDGLLSGTPHPRVFGAFPRILGKYVREAQALSLEEAVAKMTGKAALAMGLSLRGFIKTAYFADLAIWDKEIISDCGTFKVPNQRPVGIHHVIVNGTPTILNGVYTGNRNGRVLKGD